jgi:hypothetical protein
VEKIIKMITRCGKNKNKIKTKTKQNKSIIKRLGNFPTSQG